MLTVKIFEDFSESIRFLNTIRLSLLRDELVQIRLICLASLQETHITLSRNRESSMLRIVIVAIAVTVRERVAYVRNRN